MRTRRLFLQMLIGLVVGSFAKKLKLIKATADVTQRPKFLRLVAFGEYAKEVPKRAYHHYFFVPHRIVWSNWEEFISNEK